jgi:hypothetical protein
MVCILDRTDDMFMRRNTHTYTNRCTTAQKKAIPWFFPENRHTRGIWGSKYGFGLAVYFGLSGPRGAPRSNIWVQTQKSVGFPTMTEASTFSHRFKQICDYFKTCYTDSSLFSSRDQHGPYFLLTRPVSPYRRSLPRFA